MFCAFVTFPCYLCLIVSIPDLSLEKTAVKDIMKDTEEDSRSKEELNREEVIDHTDEKDKNSVFMYHVHILPGVHGILMNMNIIKLLLIKLITLKNQSEIYT